MNNILDKRFALKTKLQNRDRMFVGWISYAHPSITETFAHAGFDFIVIDMEHSTISLEQAQRIIAASQSEGVPCLPRPVSHSNDYFKPLLDSGADGLLVQMVNTAEEVENIIADIKFPPIGRRTYGVNRAQSYGFDFDAYTKSWNQSSSLLLQIESIQAVENIEKLLDFEEVNGVMIGPYDMAGSMGVPGQTSHPKVIGASRTVIDACERFKKSCGTQVADTTSEAVQSQLEQGYTFVVLGSDLFILWKWAEKMRSLMQSYR